jgi:uncharacterized repeat protein (TIGR02543 family)
MKKITSIGAGLALVATSLVGFAAPAQAVVPTTDIQATLNNAGDAVLLKCLAGAYTAATTATLNAYYVTVNGNSNISNTKTLAGDTITLGILSNGYLSSDTLTVEVRDQDIRCNGRDFAWGAAYVVVMNKTVSYDANQGAGSETATSGTGALTVSSGAGLSRAGYTLSGWNTAANGSGTAIALGANYTPTQNTTLFAQWNLIPVATGYTGPLFNPIEGRAINATTGGKVVLTGRNLAKVTKVSIAGKACEIKTDSEGRIEVTLPAGQPGQGNLEVAFGGSSLLWENAFTYFDPTKVRPAWVAPKAVKVKRKK